MKVSTAQNLASYDLRKKKKFTFMITQGESVVDLIDAYMSF